MKLLLSGLGADTDLDTLQERMRHFGPVLDILVVREGDPERPWFVVDMDITPDIATEVARRIERNPRGATRSPIFLTAPDRTPTFRQP
jgi:hypothetical protein